MIFKNREVLWYGWLYYIWDGRGEVAVSACDKMRQLRQMCCDLDVTGDSTAVIGCDLGVDEGQRKDDWRENNNKK